ncbi:MAG TPA: T9SS type A sorting domain-containing protein, partial [Bacteroidota bacterium]
DTLRFTPGSTGGYSGRLIIASNAPSNPDTITVSGSGIPSTDVSNNVLTPDTYSLGQNFPNPFNPSTNIKYGLRTRSTVRLVVFNIIGQIVDDLVNGEQEKGFYSVTWNPALPSGVYFYRIDVHSVVKSSEHFSQIRKMILMK